MAAARALGPVRSAVLTVFIVLAGMLVLLYLLRIANLLLFVHESPGPPRSVLPDVPAAVQVLEDGHQCASGGCWWELQLVPPAGQTPGELAAELGVESEACSPGNPWDPRSTCIGSYVQTGGVLFVYAAHWSRCDETALNCGWRP